MSSRTRFFRENEHNRDNQRRWVMNMHVDTLVKTYQLFLKIVFIVLIRTYFLNIKPTDSLIKEMITISNILAFRGLKTPEVKEFLEEINGLIKIIKARDQMTAKNYEIVLKTYRRVYDKLSKDNIESIKQLSNETIAADIQHVIRESVVKTRPRKSVSDSTKLKQKNQIVKSRKRQSQKRGRRSQSRKQS
jgi:hypothetical protein